MPKEPSARKKSRGKRGSGARNIKKLTEKKLTKQSEGSLPFTVKIIEDGFEVIPLLLKDAGYINGRVSKVIGNLKTINEETIIEALLQEAAVY